MYFGHRRRGLGSKERRPIQFLLSRFRIFPATLVANVWKSREMLLLGVFVRLGLCYVALLFNTSQSSRIDIAIIP